MPAEQMQTISRAVAVLDCFNQERYELGVREIARMLNLSTSAAGRLLGSMREMGILSQNPQTRTYSMGARVLTWAGVYNASLDVHNKALSAIQELHQTTRESISLYIFDGSDRLCIERLESPQSVRIVTRVGRKLPLYAGSAGKVMLAYLPAARQEEILQKTSFEPLTPRTITDPQVLRSELKKIREQGCSVSFGEWVEDAAGVAAPILDHNGEVIAALSISGPTSRFTDEVVKKYCVEVKRVAAQISESMGFINPISVSFRSEEHDHSG